MEQNDDTTDSTRADADGAAVAARKRLGAELADTRKRRDLTQEQLARDVGLHQASVSRAELGKPVTTTVLCKMLCGLGVELELRLARSEAGA